MTEHEAPLWEAVIKVNRRDEPERRACAIADGIRYACALLVDEYGWSAETVEAILENARDDVYDRCASD
jgi:hypothetical protein